MIKIDFDYNTQYGVFRDALYLPSGSVYTEDEIEAMKLQRLNNWINIIENPPADPVDPPVEE